MCCNDILGWNIVARYDVALILNVDYGVDDVMLTQILWHYDVVR